MIETLHYKGKNYPKFQASGNAARFIIPFAQEVCKGAGLDVGYSKPEWKFPGAVGVDPNDKSKFKYFNGEVLCNEYAWLEVNSCKHWEDKVPQYGATNLPRRPDSYIKGGIYPGDGERQNWDYIFSSHCLEHLDDWVRVLDYWYTMIREGGTLFLYLPAYEQEYWRPWNNTKHKNIFTPEIMYDYFKQKGFKKIFVSGVDLNASFAVMGEK